MTELLSAELLKENELLDWSGNIFGAIQGQKNKL